MWAARIGTMANAVVVLAAALFALMILAMGTAIGFATRGAMAGNREIVEVLHLVGVSDAFIAREFQTHFRRLGFRGSIIGGLAAMTFFPFDLRHAITTSNLCLLCRKHQRPGKKGSRLGA